MNSPRFVWPAWLGGVMRQYLPQEDQPRVFIARPLLMRENGAGRPLHVPHEGTAHDGFGHVLAYLRPVGTAAPDYAEVRLDSGETRHFAMAWLHPTHRVVELRPRHANPLRRTA